MFQISLVFPLVKKSKYLYKSYNQMTVSDKDISVEKLSEKTLMSNLKWVE